MCCRYSLGSDPLDERVRKILSLMEKRDSFYTQAAQIQLFTDEMSVRETARCAARQIKITVEKIPQIR